MGKKLIIVESPTKIKTLKKFLGSNYIFESSLGHIRDLPKKGFGIDVEHDFEPQYAVLPEKKEVIERLKKAAKQCDEVYLSPDPDREGEAIAWHIASILPPGTKVQRVSFNSITKEAVVEALSHPGNINFALVNAQQARRLLDRIVGYKISPILARRVQRGRDGSVSAGRVQSVALKLVVDREKEIEAFKPIEYWTISATLQSKEGGKSFKATLYSVDGKRIEKEPQEGKEMMTIGSEEEANAILRRLENVAWRVIRVEKKEKHRHPVAPFITSTLQQEASRHYGFSAARTMSTAQSLYEGVDLGPNGSEGLITYMRTDSVRVAPEAVSEVRRFISEKYGANYLPSSPRAYTSKKSAQDAHEAIRPTSLRHSPEQIKAYLSRDQYLLYDLIWKRFVASQMISALFDTVSADIEAGQKMIFRATGSILRFAGFLAVYEEKEDDEKSDESRMLPPLEEGQPLKEIDVTSEQSFTKPPPRFTEASLVKELEKSGIGRPSTYATIMNKIQSREYTVKESQRLKPTELGRVICELLENNFQEIMNIGFTAQMEDDLELIAENRRDWKELIRGFWAHFIPVVELAEKEAFVPKVMTELLCPKCGSLLQKIWSHSRYFYGCSKYPDCDYSASADEISFKKEDYAADFNWDQPCPLCQSPMKLRHGRFGAFLGCTRYPDCKGIVNIPKAGEAVIPAADMPACPAIGCEGHLVARKSRFGKTFYSCSAFPDCDVIVNDLDQLTTKYVGHPKTPYVKKGRAAKTSKKSASKKTTKTKTAKRVQKGLTLSKELAAVLGVTEASRPEATKKLWEYIKANQLQDPKNKRKIIPDSKLEKVFKTKEPVDMMQVAKLLSPHFLA